MGRPTKYDPSYCAVAEKLCATMGATDAQLAEFFEVNEDTINEWKKVYPEFSESLKRGKALTDDKVVEALFRRATGYKHDAVKIMQYEGDIIEAPYTEHYPPDTTACIYWLKNRRPEEWREKKQEETPKNISINFNLTRAPTRPSELRRQEAKTVKNGTNDDE